MVANGSGVQGSTLKKIGMAWVLTLPASMLLAGCLFTFGRALFL
jgi:PiT family inorganic phosphate transporter